MNAAVNSGDTSWVLFSAAAVLFMTPGLALFYAGMVSRRNTLVMLQQNVIPLGVITLTWVLVGYSLAFGTDAGTGFIADLKLLGLRDLGDAPPPALHVVNPDIAIPTLAFVAYQMMFAVITPALATGAVANRLKPLGWAVFLAAWSILVYPPIAHWLWAPAGWLTSRGAQDWAGGMVVHASAGAAALALLVVLGRRRVWPDRAPLPHSIPFVIVGAGMLWFGWFGFNAGDGLQANGVAAQALVNTQVAAAAAMLVWLVVERVKDGHATVLGGVTGAVGGLATITPQPARQHHLCCSHRSPRRACVPPGAPPQDDLQVRRRPRRHRRPLRRRRARVAARRSLRRRGRQQHRSRRSLFRGLASHCSATRCWRWSSSSHSPSSSPG